MTSMKPINVTSFFTKICHFALKKSSIQVTIEGYETEMQTEITKTDCLTSYAKYSDEIFNPNY